MRLGQGIGGDDRVEIGVGRQARGQLGDQLEQVAFHVGRQCRVLPGQQFRLEEHAAVGQRLGQAFGRAQLLNVGQAGEQSVDGRAQVDGGLVGGRQVLQEFEQAVQRALAALLAEQLLGHRQLFLTTAQRARISGSACPAPGR